MGLFDILYSITDHVDEVQNKGKEEYLQRERQKLKDKHYREKCNMVWARETREFDNLGLSWVICGSNQIPIVFNLSYIKQLPYDKSTLEYMLIPTRGYYPYNKKYTRALILKVDYVSYIYQSAEHKYEKYSPFFPHDSDWRIVLADDDAIALNTDMVDVNKRLITLPRPNTLSTQIIRFPISEIFDDPEFPATTEEDVLQIAKEIKDAITQWSYDFNREYILNYKSKYASEYSIGALYHKLFPDVNDGIMSYHITNAKKHYEKYKDINENNKLKKKEEPKGIKYYDQKLI